MVVRGQFCYVITRTTSGIEGIAITGGNRNTNPDQKVEILAKRVAEVGHGRSSSRSAAG